MKIIFVGPSLSGLPKIADGCTFLPPAELDYMPLNEPLVDIEATLAALVDRGAISPSEHTALWQAARRIFFKERTLERIVGSAGIASDRAATVVAAYEANRVNLKQRDALALVDRMTGLDARPEPAATADWQLAQPASWRDALAELRAPAPGNHPSI